MVDNIIAVNSWKHFSNGWFIFAICDVIQRLAISANSESFNNCKLIFCTIFIEMVHLWTNKRKSTKNEFISLKQQIPSCVLADRMQFTTFHFRLHCRQLITTYHGIPYNMKRVVIWRNKKKTLNYMWYNKLWVGATEWARDIQQSGGKKARAWKHLNINSDYGNSMVLDHWRVHKNDLKHKTIGR